METSNSSDKTINLIMLVLLVLYVLAMIFLTSDHYQDRITIEGIVTSVGTPDRNKEYTVAIDQTEYRINMDTAVQNEPIEQGRGCLAVYNTTTDTLEFIDDSFWQQPVSLLINKK